MIKPEIRSNENYRICIAGGVFTSLVENFLFSDLLRDEHEKAKLNTNIDLYINGLDHSVNPLIITSNEPINKNGFTVNWLELNRFFGGDEPRPLRLRINEWKINNLKTTDHLKIVNDFDLYPCKIVFDYSESRFLIDKEWLNRLSRGQTSIITEKAKENLANFEERYRKYKYLKGFFTYQDLRQMIDWDVSTSKKSLSQKNWN